MKRITAFAQSTLGKKVIIAVTGLIMLGFLLGHVSGNLKVFLPDTQQGQADIDHYAEFLRSIGEPLLPHAGVLWMARVILLASLVLHVFFVVQLSAQNNAARPEGYEGQKHSQATLPARMMMVSGVLVLVFIVLHILHFTTGTIDPANFEEGHVYWNLFQAFQQWPIVAGYMIAVAVVGFHLYHGAWSMFQTVGLDNPDRNRGLRLLAIALAVALFVGFAAVPASFIAGGLSPPKEDRSEDTEAAQRISFQEKR